jgi:hypothetical protein
MGAGQGVSEITVLKNAIAESSVLSSRMSDPQQLAVVKGAVPGPAAFGTKRGPRVEISTSSAMTLATSTS